jgi:hypothetical protein
MGLVQKIDASTRGDVFQARLYRRTPLQGVSKDGDDLMFPLNPNSVRYSLGTRYADSPVPGRDYGPGAPASYPPAFSWVANTPQIISVEFLLAHQETRQFRGIAPRDIEAEIRTLKGFCLKDPRTKEPPDLVFQMGEQFDIVRVSNLDIEPIQWLPNGRRYQARVRLELRTLHPDSK